MGGPPLGPLRVAAYARRRGARGGGETLAALHDGARRAPGRGPRLEDHRGERGGRAGAAARARHDGRRVPDRPGAARLPARRAGRRGRHRRAAWRAPTAIAERAVRHARAGRAPARAARGGRAHRLFHEVELPLVDVLVEMERAGVKLDVERLREISERFDERVDELEQRVWELAGRGVHDRLAAAARRRSCSRSSGCRASAAARPASPPTRACSRRSATSTRSSRRSRSGASSRS